MTADYRDPVDYYRTHAEAFDATRSRDLAERGWLDAFLAELPEGGTVLDAGCGTGDPLASYIAERGFRLTGIDSTPAFLALARERVPQGEFVEGDLRDFDLGRQFDGILAWDSFFHLSVAEQRKCLARLAAHARPSAVLMFNSGGDEGEAINPLFGENLYHASLSPAEYRAILRQHGFAILHHAESDPSCGGRTIWLAKRNAARASTLGFSVEELLPRARGGGALKIGLAKLSEAEWLQPSPDLTARAQTFDAHPESVQLTPEAEAPARELAAMRGVTGGLEGAARSAWEDMCLLLPREGEDIYRLIGAAVAFPTDWNPADKMGLPLASLHGTIHGYEDQLASGVDRFMTRLKPGAIYGRCNWFVSPTPALRWIAQGPPEQEFAHVTADNAGGTLFIRSERQTLRRLPQTGAVLFTIGVYVSPLGALSPANIARMAKALATIPPEEAERRGAAHFAPALQAYAARHGHAIEDAA